MYGTVPYGLKGRVRCGFQQAHCAASELPPGKVAVGASVVLSLPSFPHFHLHLCQGAWWAPMSALCGVRVVCRALPILARD